MQTLSPPRADQHQVDHATAREQPSEGQFDADTMEDIRSPQVHGLQPQAVQAKAQQPSTLYTLIEDSDVLALLGSMTDAELSRRTGISANKIYSARKARGIPRYDKMQVRLTNEVMRLLGTMSDRSLSKLTGVTCYVIREARSAHNIPSFSQHKGKQHKGTKSEPRKRRYLPNFPNPIFGFAKPPYPPVQAGKGIVLPYLNDVGRRLLVWASDVYLSKRLNISLRAVGKLRAQHGIPGLHLRSAPPNGLLDELGKLEDVRLAEKYKVDVRLVRKLRRELRIKLYKKPHLISPPPGALEMLGKAADHILAQRFGHHAAYYRNARRERGIKPYQPKDLRDYDSQLDADLKNLLTWASDSELVRQTGLSVFKIKKYREAHDIPLLGLKQCPPPGLIEACLLYTSDAADE